MKQYSNDLASRQVEVKQAKRFFEHREGVRAAARYAAFELPIAVSHPEVSLASASARPPTGGRAAEGHHCQQVFPLQQLLFQQVQAQQQQVVQRTVVQQVQLKSFGEKYEPILHLL